MKQKNKNVDFLACYQAHQTPVYQERQQQEKVQETGKEQLEQDKISNVASSFNEVLNTKVLSKFNSVLSRNNLPEIKDGTYVIILKKNLDECKSFETHWIAFSVNGDDVT